MTDALERLISPPERDVVATLGEAHRHGVRDTVAYLE